MPFLPPRPRKKPGHWNQKRLDPLLKRDIILFVLALALAVIAVGVVVVQG